jgi:hypothetical protein
VPSGKLDGDIVIEDDVMPTAMEYVLVPVRDASSVALTVKLYVEAVVGVPEITPAVLNDSPAGRLPSETVKV